MSATSFKELKEHLGHAIELVSYKDRDEEIYLECTDCNEVLKEYLAK